MMWQLPWQLIIFYWTTRISTIASQTQAYLGKLKYPGASSTCAVIIFIFFSEGLKKILNTNKYIRLWVRRGALLFHLTSSFTKISSWHCCAPEELWPFKLQWAPPTLVLHWNWWFHILRRCPSKEWKVDNLADRRTWQGKQNRWGPWKYHSLEVCGINLIHNNSTMKNLIL